MTRWLVVKCPHCKAAGGEPCTGKPRGRYRVHAPRVDRVLTLEGKARVKESNARNGW